MKLRKNQEKVREILMIYAKVLYLSVMMLILLSLVKSNNSWSKLSEITVILSVYSKIVYNLAKAIFPPPIIRTDFCSSPKKTGKKLIM